MENLINIALVGCGRISYKHIDAIFQNFNKARLVALCDTSDARLNEAINLISKLAKENQENNSTQAIFNDYDLLLKSIKNKELKVDLIVLATPSGLHPKQVISAAHLNINICTEKPMATSWDKGNQMVEACEKSGASLFVVKQNRFNKTLKLLKKQIEKGRFGQISMINSNVFWQRPQNYYDQDKWRGTWEFDGGALMNQASHYVDLLGWLGGPIECVNASIATIGRRIEVEDTAALRLKWRNGALGTMAVTMLTYPRNLEGSIIILGEKGTVKIGGSALNNIDYWEFDDNDIDDNEIKESNYSIDNVYGHGHKDYYENMINSLLGKEEAMCNGREGLKSLEILIAAYRSSRDGKTIHLPLKF